MTKQLAWFSLAVLLALGCDDGTTDLDAGTGVEGGVDSGGETDAGDPVREDAGEPADAGDPMDAGSTVDAGDTADAGDETDGGTTPGLTKDEFLEAWLARLCELFTECEAKLGAGAIGFEAIGCHPEGASLIDAQYGGSLAAGAVTFDAAIAQSCLDSLDPLTCEDLYPASGAAPDVNCLRAFVPTVAAGGDCAFDGNCVDGWCDIDNACPGTCVGTVGAGLDCTRDIECESGLVCFEGECGSPRGAGASCFSSANCGGGRVCIDAECQPRAELGEDCNGSDTCVGDLICVDSMCVEGVGESESCDADTPCTSGLRCNPTPDVCVTISPRGGACGTNIQCAIGTWCEGGTCEPLPVPGESCSLAPACLYGNCVDGTCAIGGLGDACVSGLYDPCDDGLTCQSGECVTAAGEGGGCIGVPCDEGLTCVTETAPVAMRCRPTRCAP